MKFQKGIYRASFIAKEAKAEDVSSYWSPQSWRTGLASRVACAVQHCMKGTIQLRP